eukprot:1449077-Rhodomonas_salina.1
MTYKSNRVWRHALSQSRTSHGTEGYLSPGLCTASYALSVPVTAQHHHISKYRTLRCTARSLSAGHRKAPYALFVPGIAWYRVLAQYRASHRLLAELTWLGSIERLSSSLCDERAREEDG